MTSPSSPSSDPIQWANRPGHEIHPDGTITIHNLLKSTVAAATHELIKEGVDWTLSVFVDNAGVIAFDDNHAVCIKVETHNHPRPSSLTAALPPASAAASATSSAPAWPLAPSPTPTSSASPSPT